MTWTPLIIDEKQKKCVLSRLELITKDIQILDDESILNGKTGIALYFYYFSSLTNKNEYKEKATYLFSECLRAISGKKMSANFALGFIGIAWSLLHLHKNGFLAIKSDSMLSDLDEYIYRASEINLKKNFFDVWHGGLGGGLYFLERLPNSFATVAIAKFIDDLYYNAEKANDEIKWSNDFFKNNLITLNNNKEYNLGLSHGIPSIICFLSMAYGKGISKERCFALLNGSIAWLLKQRLCNNQKLISLFPNFVQHNIKSGNSRLSWCYGDLSIAISLWQAGSSVNNECWKNEAINILLHSTKRKSQQENLIFDSCLCHGTIGIAHIYNRFFQQTGIVEFKNSAIFWIRKAFERKFIDGIGGFKTYDGDNGWINNSGLLLGVAGIGLSLMSFISDQEPKWDKMFYLS